MRGHLPEVFHLLFSWCTYFTVIFFLDLTGKYKKYKNPVSFLFYHQYLLNYPFFSSEGDSCPALPSLNHCAVTWCCFPFHFSALLSGFAGITFIYAQSSCNPHIFRKITFESDNYSFFLSFSLWTDKNSTRACLQSLQECDTLLVQHGVKQSPCTACTLRQALRLMLKKHIHPHRRGQNTKGNLFSMLSKGWRLRKSHCLLVVEYKKEDKKSHTAHNILFQVLVKSFSHSHSCY